MYTYTHIGTPDTTRDAYTAHTYARLLLSAGTPDITRDTCIHKLYTTCIPHTYTDTPIHAQTCVHTYCTYIHTHVFCPVQVPLVTGSLRGSLSQLAVAVDRHGVGEIDHAHRHLLLDVSLERRVRGVVRQQEGARVKLEDFLPRKELRHRANLAEGALHAAPAQARAVVEETVLI